jgi:lipoprotein NlpD
MIFTLLLTTFVSPLAQDVRTHTVEPGETLSGIARQYSIPLRQLLEQNRIESPDLVLPGTILTISQWHEVVRGDTLFGIARAYETSVETIRRLNNLEDSMIRTGQRLQVPPQQERGASRVAAEPNQSRTPSRTTTAPAETPSSSSSSREDSSRSSARSSTSEERSEERSPDVPVVVPVAVAVENPISFADGGAWPVAGQRTNLDGKLPGVMIRAARGTPVLAISTGRVVYAGPHSTFGNVVFVQTSQGYIYVYGGQEDILVEVGDMVSAGNVVGAVGISPAEQEGALYFSVWRNNQFVDPATAPRG